MKYFIVLIIVGLLGISPIIAYTTSEIVMISVKDKERIVTGSGSSLSSKYLVFTDGEVFENTDSIWYWKFDSSDMYGSLEPGTSYTAKVYGFRIPFLSWYRNIVEVTPLNI